MKTKKNLEVGKKYRGYAILNEFGEINFTPEQTGARLGERKIIFEGDNYTVTEAKHVVTLHISVGKQPTMQLVKEICLAFNDATSKLMEYEI